MGLLSISIHKLLHMHHVVRLAPLGHIITATIDKHIRLVESADALCHFPMSLGSVQPSRHSASAKSVVTFGHSERVDLFKVWRHVQIYPNLRYVCQIACAIGVWSCIEQFGSTIALHPDSSNLIGSLNSCSKR